MNTEGKTKKPFFSEKQILRFLLDPNAISAYLDENILPDDFDIHHEIIQSARLHSEDGILDLFEYFLLLDDCDPLENPFLILMQYLFEPGSVEEYLIDESKALPDVLSCPIGFPVDNLRIQHAFYHVAKVTGNTYNNDPAYTILDTINYLAFPYNGKIDNSKMIDLILRFYKTILFRIDRIHSYTPNPNLEKDRNFVRDDSYQTTIDFVEDFCDLIFRYLNKTSINKTLGQTDPEELINSIKTRLLGLIIDNNPQIRFEDRKGCITQRLLSILKNPAEGISLYDPHETPATFDLFDLLYPEFTGDQTIPSLGETLNNDRALLL
jgi:hypothetical protein